MSGLKRNNNEKYYTIPKIAELCVQEMDKYILDKNVLIIEPSAGNGSFISDIKSLTSNFKFYDLEPENNEIIKQDFLELKVKKYNGKIHIIGNPPFGRQSSLAIKFIKKCCEFASSISFILPKSFKKESMKKHFDKYYHLIYEGDLSENSFLVNNIEVDVPCIFQIWEKKSNERESIKKVNPIGFKFVKNTELPDISFRRVGVYAGKISTDIKDKSIQSHYFIKFTINKPITDILKKLTKIKFDTNNTVGPKSISKQELIKEFNLHLK